MQMATFLGPDEHFAQDWQEPRVEGNVDRLMRHFGFTADGLTIEGETE